MIYVSTAIGAFLSTAFGFYLGYAGRLCSSRPIRALYYALAAEHATVSPVIAACDGCGRIVTLADIAERGLKALAACPCDLQMSREARVAEAKKQLLWHITNGGIEPGFFHNWEGWSLDAEAINERAEQYVSETYG